ncbi:MAG: MFS transporter [Rhodospirillaceae bacterium]|nr:MAG: MFS transporter [Rhodospirillaceae bacterium]
MIARHTVLYLGLSQLICWGTIYYLIGGFGDLMAADLGWSQSLVYGGFSLALLVMGLVSPLVGRLIDRYGGRIVMLVGSFCSALGCVILASAHGIAGYYAAWFCLGLAMRLTLYEAAFAALARIGGPLARRPISQITLLGGLASSVFWPIGHVLAEHLGWRGAVFVYAALALLTVPLHLAIPNRRYQPPAASGMSGDTPPQSHAPASTPLARTQQDRRLAGGLYALIAMCTNFLNAGMSAHMIALLGGLGLAAGIAVSTAALRGIGQSSARACEVLFGGRLHPLALNLVTIGLLPVCFLAGLFGGQWPLAAMSFAFLYGAGNGIATITRGTLPLVLFDPGSYGAITGKLLVPSFLAAAAAPLLYAFIIEHAGDFAAIWFSLVLGLATFAASLLLKWRFDPGRRP